MSGWVRIRFSFLGMAICRSGWLDMAGWHEFIYWNCAIQQFRSRRYRDCATSASQCLINAQTGKLDPGYAHSDLPCESAEKMH
jgi:hypothetical protein